MGASQDPCTEIYAGPKPESEPCVVAVRDYVMKKLKTMPGKQLVAFYTYHSYGQYWLHPPGWTTDKIPGMANLVSSHDCS